MDTKEQELTADIRKKAMAYIKIVRTRHEVTMNPSSASPGEGIFVRTPKLAPGLCLWSLVLFSCAVRFQESQYQDPLPE